MASDRLKKVNDLIRDEVAKIVRSDLELEGALVTIISASVSPTLEHATIKISVLPVERGESVMKTLKKQIYDMQQALNSRVAMRPVPKIRFQIDTTEENAARIEKLIGDVQEDDDDIQ